MDQNPRDPLIRSFERHLRAENRSERTIATYLIGLRQADAFLRAHSTTLEAATRADLEAFLADVLSRRSASTAATYYKPLKLLYAWLLEEEEIPADPMRRMKRPMVPDKPVPIVPADGLKRLFRACAGNTFEGRRDTALIMLLLDTGARRDEMAGLKLADVDLELDVLLVLGKGRRERTLPLRAQGRRGAGPLPARPSSPQGRRDAVAVAREAGPLDRVGAGVDAAPPRRASRPAWAASASVPSHLRPPVAGRRWW